jgi:hypothetical protein
MFESSRSDSDRVGDAHEKRKTEEIRTAEINRMLESQICIV